MNPRLAAADQIASTANTVSGLGEHGLANQLWSLAGRLRAAEVSAAYALRDQEESR